MLKLFPCREKGSYRNCYSREFCLICMFDVYKKQIRLCSGECEEYAECGQDALNCPKFQKLYNAACFSYCKYILSNLHSPTGDDVEEGGDAFITLKTGGSKDGIRYSILREISDREEVLNRVRNGRLSEKELRTLTELYLNGGSLRSVAGGDCSHVHIKNVCDRAIAKVAHVFKGE